MPVEENIAALLRELQQVNTLATAVEAPQQTTEILAKMLLLLTRDHPRRQQVESLITTSIIVALDIVETSASALN